MNILSTEIKDIPEIKEIESRAENNRFIIPYSAARHQEVIKNADEVHFKIIIDQKIVGFIILAGLESRHQALEFRRIVIAKKGKGLGRKAIQWIKKYAFETLGFHRLWLDVFDFNDPAQHLYTSEGFTREGLLRECYLIDGNYQNLMIMSMLKTEYFSKPL